MKPPWGSGRRAPLWSGLVQGNKTRKEMVYPFTGGVGGNRPLTLQGRRGEKFTGQYPYPPESTTFRESSVLGAQHAKKIYRSEPR